MDKKLKVAIFTDNFFPGVGGTENATVNIAKELVNLGHEVVLVAPHYKGENDSNLPFKVLRKNSFKIDANDYYALPIFNHKLFKQLDQFKPDIIHCQTQASMLTLALKYAKKRKIPCIATMHTKFSYAYRDAVKCKFLTDMALKKIGKKLNKANYVTAVSYTMKDEFDIYNYHGDFTMIKNGACFEKTNLELDKTLAQNKFGIDSCDNILLFVGRMTKVKNIDFIFNSLDALFKNYKNFKMVFVGKGDDEAMFKRIASSKPYASQVQFLGQITDRNLLSSIYANAKLFLFPSIFDNDGLTIVEAALNSVPSIVIENTGASERITNNQNGFTITNNPDEMAKKIEFLLENPLIIEKIGANAKQDLPMTWTSVVEKYIEIYNQELQKKSLN